MDKKKVWQFRFLLSVHVRLSSRSAKSSLQEHSYLSAFLLQTCVQNFLSFRSQGWTRQNYHNNYQLLIIIFLSIITLNTQLSIVISIKTSFWHSFFRATYQGRNPFHFPTIWSQLYTCIDLRHLSSHRFARTHLCQLCHMNGLEINMKI